MCRDCGQDSLIVQCFLLCGGRRQGERLGSGRGGGFDGGKPGCWAWHLEAAPAAPGAVGCAAWPGRERARWRPDGGWTRCPEPIVSLLIRNPTVESDTRRPTASVGLQQNTAFGSFHTATREPTKSQLDIPLYCWFANSINSIVGS